MKLASRYVFKRWYKRLAAFSFDLCGAALDSSRLDTPLELSRIKKIVAVRLDHLGDVIMTRPALAALHRAMPHSMIDLVVSAEIAPLIRRDPWLHEIIPVSDHWFSRKTTSRAVHSERIRLLNEVRSRHYDLAVDFRGDLRIIYLFKQAKIPYRLGYGITGGGFWLTHTRPYDFEAHQVPAAAALLDSLGIKETVQPQAFFYSQEEKTRFLQKFPFLAAGTRDRVIVHTAAGYPSKQWEAVKFRELLNRLLRENPQMQVVLIGTEKEKADFRVEENSRMMDLRGKTALEELPVLFDLAGFYIGNDSGPAHLAAAQGLPGVVIFSGTNIASVWKPWSEKFKTVQYEVSCSPCEAKVCPLMHHACMKMITVDQVYEAVRAMQGLEVKKT